MGLSAFVGSFNYLNFGLPYKNQLNNVNLRQAKLPTIYPPFSQYSEPKTTETQLQSLKSFFLRHSGNFRELPRTHPSLSLFYVKTQIFGLQGDWNQIL